MESLTNNTIQPLAIGQLWSGISEFRNNTVTIAVNLITTKNCIVTVSQATDNVNFVFTDNFAHDVTIIGTQSRFQVSAKAQFMKVSVLNDSGEEIPQSVVTTYFNDVNIDSTLEQPVIVAGSVNVLNSMKATNYEFDTLRNVACDDTGKLLTIHSPNGTQDVNIVSTVTIPVSGTLSIDNFPGYQPSIEVSNFPATQTVDGTVAISNTSFSTFSGANTDFAFYPDATNSTSAIYADGQQPTATNQAGWVYTNNGVAPNKINWYVFQDTTLPQYTVSQMESIYFVITQLPTATSLPYVSFYTMPNGIDDLVPNFAKSSLVFAPSGAVPITEGEYLFYVSADPTSIRPEITNRYELSFVAGQSSKTLAQASGERLSLATLSTNSTDPAGSNYFLFQQYGIQWAKNSAFLPVNNGKLETTETNSGAISTTLTSLNGKVTACNTGAISGSVSITGTVNETNSTSIYNTLVQVNGKIVACDTGNVTLSNTTGIKSFDATNLIVKRAISVVANVLLSLNYYNDAGSVNFVLVYNLGIASVTVGTTGPIAVFALAKNHGDTIDLHRLLVGTAITLAVSGSYDGTSVPHGNGAYLTVSFLTA
jgi:hypothetical protein